MNCSPLSPGTRRRLLHGQAGPLPAPVSRSVAIFISSTVSGKGQGRTGSSGGARANGHGSQYPLGDLDVNTAWPVTHTHRDWWGRASLTLCFLPYKSASEPDLRELLSVANDSTTNINDECSKLGLKSAWVFPQLQSSVWQDLVYSPTLSGVTLTSHPHPPTLGSNRSRNLQSPKPQKLQLFNWSVYLMHDSSSQAISSMKAESTVCASKGLITCSSKIKTKTPDSYCLPISVV